MKAFIQKILNSKFSRDTIWLILAQLVVLVVGFLLNFGIEGHYGLDQLGYFTQSTSFYLIFSNLFSLGLNNTTIKRVSEFASNREKQFRIFSQNLMLSLGISVMLSLFVMTLLMIFPKLFSSEEVVALLKIQLIGVPFFCANKQFAALYSGQRRQRTFAIQRLIRWTSIGVLLLIAILIEYPVWYVILAFVVVEIGVFLYNVVRNVSSMRFNWVSEELKANLSFGIKSYIAEILAVFNSNMDVILLGYLLDPKEMGIYSFMIFFIKALYIFPGIIMQNMSPVISVLWESKQIQELQRKVSLVSRVNMIVAFLQFVGVIVVYYLIVTYFKDSMIGSTQFFIIAAIGAFIFSLVSWSGSMLVMSGKLKVNFQRTLLVLIISTINILVFGYYFGLLGAAIAVGLNGVFNFIIMGLLIRKEMGIKVIL
ncbi:MAG: oligosaccharide flippase family protein [Flavobacteriales bacterium]|nr:oligosaccharide flippase family protein [Flavobacteriales bacterium]